jgi:hypothetical protein
MAEDFPGDYRPFGVDVILLIEWFSVVQLLGKSRKLDSHASLGVTQIALKAILETAICRIRYTWRERQKGRWHQSPMDSLRLDRQCAQIRV